MNKISKKGPIALVIFDGFGYKNQVFGNAIKAAKMPFFEFLLKNYPSTLLNASGKAVGLLPKFIGNSEVGHLTMGAGRIIKSTLAKFKEVVDNKTIFKNKVLINNFKKIKADNALHIIGLLSDGGVHSHEFQLFALLEFAKKQNIKNVYIHVILDGRDVPPKSANIHLKKLDKICKKLNLGKIASIHGRFYSMDRDNNWQRTKKSYDILCDPKIKISNLKNWEQLLKNFYAKNITDEFVNPTLFIKNGQIKTGDGVIFYNFRPDRARQLTQSFIDPDFNKFKTQNLNSTNNTLAFFITTTRYMQDFKNFNNDILFEHEKIDHTLLDEISTQSNAKIFVIAETEKYAHVTYFFRGMNEKKLPNETYNLISSIKAKNYINHPEMSAYKITRKVLASLKNDPANFYLINYANADMVGHSGDFDATVKACECLDVQIKKLYDEIVINKNGTIFLTSDHGNAEEMINKKTGELVTAHTINPVIFIKINQKSQKNKPEITKFGPIKLELSNIAATILQDLGLKIPTKMIKKRIF
ncbi:2,3-bisphosphoglycerate-independent phosphoglycerate mutase [Candidatus Dependentiae bacterium]|nr:2,3-bisphosphoglycerate-independent phosphoglycerate mutase [Candidatus Dependentiae bacterium]MBU4387193.1 2,3-bisphosphoglycerate-independent phosphoglycerate mutase [Candidatus Dependentiae bacterium]MCG2756173.1 2,3-bisphosphoglycerate-independent phosphoglycerate mutase [Candidatus Dependentiae bacterium]